MSMGLVSSSSSSLPPHATTEEKEFNLDDMENLPDLILVLKCLGHDVTKGTAVAENSIYRVKLFVEQSTHRIVDVEDIIRSIFSDDQYYIDVDSPQQVVLMDEGNKSVWLIETVGKSLKLLRGIIKIIQYNNIDITSVEFDTQGLVPKFKFHLSYMDCALESSLQQALTNDFFKAFPR